MQSPISHQYLASSEHLASPQHLALLKQHKLASFEQLWGYAGDWFEPPNRERGGWSGVNFIQLANEAGTKLDMYLKRQQNFMRRSLRHPFAGEPTFLREFTILQYLAKHQINAPKIVFFATQANQAILMTEALAGYLALDVWLAQNPQMHIARKKMLISAIATTIKKLHQAGVQHRSLYPKHLFIKENDSSFDVALIDFEKSRITPLIAWLKLSDLITLSRRMPQISHAHKLFFLKQYFGVSKLNAGQKRLFRYLAQKTMLKNAK